MSVSWAFGASDGHPQRLLGQALRGICLGCRNKLTRKSTSSIVNGMSTIVCSPATGEPLSLLKGKRRRQKAKFFPSLSTRSLVQS